VAFGGHPSQQALVKKLLLTSPGYSNSLFMYKSGTAEVLAMSAVASSASPASLNPDLQQLPRGLTENIITCTICSSFQLPPIPNYHVAGLRHVILTNEMLLLHGTSSKIPFKI